MPDKKSNQFIVCPVCEGFGGNKYGINCPNCAGMGLGRFYKGRFFYWGLNLSRVIIELSHLRKKIHQILNIIVYVIGLAGLLCLAAWVYSVSNSPNPEAFAFWREKNDLILIFWISVFADMFVIYRISEEERSQHKIMPLTYEEKNRNIALPDSWEDIRKLPGRQRIDVSRGFDINASEAVEKAFVLADRLGHKVDPLHVFIVILSNNQVAALFSRLNADGEKLAGRIKEQLEKIDAVEGKTVFSGIVKEAFINAYAEALDLGQKKVMAKNFIISSMEKNDILREILYEMEIDRDKIMNVLTWFMVNEGLIASHRAYRASAAYKPGSNMDRAYTSIATPALNQIGYDLTVAAKWGRLEYCVARSEEIESIFQNFESGARGVILIGELGVGKSTIVDGVAQLMVKEDVPKIFADKRLMEVDTARLISGATPAQAEGRLMAIIDEVTRAGNIILFIDNIENLIGITSGNEESLDLSEVLAGAIERGNIYCLASATSANYTKFIEGKSLGGILKKIEIKEPVGNQAIQIVESKIGLIEGRYKVYFSYNAIEEVIKLSSRYIHDKYLPAKAIEILELVAVRVSKKKGPESLITKDDAAQIVGEITNIPVAKLTESESKNLLNLEERIHEQMIDQTTAVKMVSASLRRARAELREGKRPIANFLFLGPTGVGKTELAKTVANVYFGNEKCMIRLDMSEYQHPDSIKKMIGDAAAGITGYLTEAVRRSPFSLVLLDELEKAHPDILNVFLQVMDDGRLTDGQGRTVDFTSSIIIATSNVGAVYIQDEIFKGTSAEEIKRTLINEHLNKVLRPELINRFDGVIVFEPLSMENVVAIARLMVNKIGKLLEAKGIGLKVEDEGLRVLAKLGFDPKFGARPLRRLLQEKVEDKIANKILSGELKRRDAVIIDRAGEVLTEKAKAI
ncbi:MAG: ATP-dependent Clp protease ATP-binding subunit [Candidatus Falkowbacteria bacterium]